MGLDLSGAFAVLSVCFVQCEIDQQNTRLHSAVKGGAFEGAEPLEHLVPRL
jgi:hypothetical protein